MTGLVGHGSLILALFLAAWGMVGPMLWARTGRDRFFTATLGAIVAQFVLVTVAGLALVYALVTTDFSIKYVAMNTTRATPIYYRVTGLWGALEGSLLLWEWILVICAALVAWQYSGRPSPGAATRMPASRPSTARSAPRQTTRSRSG